MNFDDLYTWFARLVVLFTSMPVHEYAHGWAASKLGDDTARKQGRLTLNPLAHLDLFGSLLLVFTGFGWAKPVQVDPRNFKKPKRDMALTSLAGPMSNIILATIVMILLKLCYTVWPAFRYQNVALVVSFLSTMLVTNLYLAVFNLIPLPPLDGAKIFGALLPERFYFTIMRYERYIMVALVLLMFLGYLSIPLTKLSSYLLRFLDFITSPLGRLT